MVERSSEPFRAFRIEEDEEGEAPRAGWSTSAFLTSTKASVLVLIYKH